jgi:uncharacterized protein YndB with AHSA1/START domain
MREGHGTSSSSIPGGTVVAETSLRIDAPPEAVWALWLDVPARPLWHPRLEWARLDGPAAVGTSGAWKPAGVRPVRVVVTDARAPRRLVLRGTHGPPVARGHYEHEIDALADGGSLVTHRLTLTGPLARPIGRLLGRPLGAFATPDALAALADALAARASVQPG